MTGRPVVTEAMRRAVGVESEPKTHLVEAGAIRKFVDAVGDPVPAYRGESPTAPPTFPRSLDAGPATVAFESPYPDLLDGGSEWQYARPIRAGDRITVTQALVDIAEKSGRLGPMLLTTWETRYAGASGAVAATQRNTLVYYRAGRGGTERPARGGGAVRPERQDPERAGRAEGARYDDAAEGDALPVLVKTPTTRQLVMYAGASGDYYEIHYDRDYARSLGLPGVIVHGALKSAFLAQLVTGWAGERGTLKRLAVQYRGMDLVGEPMRCTGSVTGKRVQNGERLVECDVWAENPSGEKTTRGSAVVSLAAG